MTEQEFIPWIRKQHIAVTTWAKRIGMTEIESEWKEPGYTMEEFSMFAEPLAHNLYFLELAALKAYKEFSDHPDQMGFIQAIRVALMEEIEGYLAALTGTVSDLAALAARVTMGRHKIENELLIGGKDKIREHFLSISDKMEFVDAVKRNEAVVDQYGMRQELRNIYLGL